jgi:DNA recombination protein RmuC
VTEFTEVGSRLKQAQQSYDDCYKKLSQGKGNVISQAEKLKQLGVKPKKELPQDIIDGASDVGEPKRPILSSSSEELTAARPH